MAIRATEKIIEALNQLLEGFSELQDAVENEYADDDEDDSDDERTQRDEAGERQDPDNAIVSEMKTAIEASMESEDYTPEEIANVIACLTEALQEIDPNIFEESESDEDEEEEDDDDDDLDFDDEDYEDDEEDDDDDD